MPFSLAAHPCIELPAQEMRSCVNSSLRKALKLMLLTRQDKHLLCMLLYVRTKGYVFLASLHQIKFVDMHADMVIFMSCSRASVK